MRFEYSFICHEKGGPRYRRVRPLELADIPRVYNSLQSVINARGRELPIDLALSEFARTDKLYWTVDDVGLLIATQAGDMHGMYWDRRFRGREHLTKTMMLISMSILGLDLAWTIMPETERAALAFAKRLGFIEAERKDGAVRLIFTRG